MFSVIIILKMYYISKRLLLLECSSQWGLKGKCYSLLEPFWNENILSNSSSNSQNCMGKLMRFLFSKSFNLKICLVCVIVFGCCLLLFFVQKWFTRVCALLLQVHSKNSSSWNKTKMCRKIMLHKPLELWELRLWKGISIMF